MRYNANEWITRRRSLFYSSRSSNLVVAARIFLARCYAQNVKTDLTVDEKKELRQIAANLKGAQ